MKYFIYFTFIVFFLACGKEPAKPSLPDDYWGEASADRNGKPWTSHPACWVSIRDYTSLVVDLDSFIEDFYLKESLNLVDIPPFLGTYKVNKLTAAYDLNSSLTMWDADLPLGGYTLLESDSNTNRVTLTSYDTLSKEIKGTFNLTYIVASRPYPSYPDTIRFRNGKFHGKLIKK